MEGVECGKEREKVVRKKEGCEKERRKGKKEEEEVFR